MGFVFAVMDGVGALGALLAGAVAEFELANAFLLAAGLSLACLAFILLGTRPAPVAVRA